jgi:ferritin
MTLKKEVLEGLNNQIKNELASAYVYLSMSAWCESQNLPGMAKWLRIQWEEETAHAMKLFDYVHARGGQVVLQGIEKPASKFKTPLGVFEEVLEHEQAVTASITKLYELALREKDYPTQVELQWFIKEQVEEEKNAGEIIELFKRAGEGGGMLLMVDRQMGMRAKD